MIPAVQGGESIVDLFGGQHLIPWCYAATPSLQLSAEGFVNFGTTLTT